MKNRKQKQEEYIKLYSHIPIDRKERLYWLFDYLKLSNKDIDQILYKRDELLSKLEYYDFNIVLFEVPEAAPRPRFRVVNRFNIRDMAIQNPNFIHVYSPVGREDYIYMKRLLDQELFQLNSLIYTPCNIEINAYIKTPSSFNRHDIYISEIGLIRPITKPDWDNIEKKYSDMFNKNVWLDDSLVIDGSIHKYYSVLPRVEIKLKYLNMLYNKTQYNSMVNKVNDINNIKYFNVKGDK